MIGRNGKAQRMLGKEALCRSSNWRVLGNDWVGRWGTGQRTPRMSERGPNFLIHKMSLTILTTTTTIITVFEVVIDIIIIIRMLEFSERM